MWLERYHSQMKSSNQKDSRDQEIQQSGMTQMNETDLQLETGGNSFYSTTPDQHLERLNEVHSSTDSSTVDNVSTGTSQLSSH